MPLTNIASRWVNGVLEYYDTRTIETVDVHAPAKHFSDFSGKAVDTTNDYNFQGTNSGAVAIQAGAGGRIRLTTGATDTNDAQLATGLLFNSNKGCVIEVKCAMNTVATQRFNVGFSDAVAESAGTLAITYATTSATSNATDAALFFHDGAATTNSIKCMAVNDDTDSAITVVDSTTAGLTDATFHIYRVEILPDRTARFFYDNELKATIATAVAANIPLCAYVATGTGATAARTLDVDYIRAWALTR